MAEPRNPSELVIVRFLQPARPFGRGDQVELTWREAEGLIAQKVAELVPVHQRLIETR